LTTLLRSQRGLRLGVALLALLPALHGYARVRHGDAWARDNFARAERMREALNGRPVAQRTRHDYQRVIDSYRRVYFGAPTSSRADSSVVAVAELQVEMGRRFDDNKIFQRAVREYEFLRKEYPGSRYRFDALFTIGEIYKDDLEDPEEALATFEEFLHRYPHNRLADQAKAAIADLKQDPDEPYKSAAQKEAEKYQKAAEFVRKSGKTEAKLQDKTSQDQERDDQEIPTASAQDVPDETAQFPRVTSIRHWSTPDYTRVAIDLEQDVKFASQRIDHPDRIFFDLYDTKLASTLVGKTFDVDDGFLKKIRVAQFKPGKTRVVLEVDDLSDYDAFLLPNPSRLIIDIRGKQGGKSELARNRNTAENAIPSKLPPDEPDDSSATRTTPSHPARVADAADREAQPTLPTNTKPTVTTVRVGKNSIKKIIEADDDIRRSSNSAARSVEDLRAELPPSASPSEGPTHDTVASTGSREKSRPKGKSRSSASAAQLDVREARPTASGDRSLIRALGLKIGKIVIDPGHGGHDTGTIGPDGLLEKDLVVDVGRRLGKLLDTRLGAQVVYTRKDDTFIPLETRTAIANQEQADLFVSIHANSSRDPNARGVETYYLNFTSSADALEVAARENAVSEKSIHELGDLVKKIALKEKIEESHEFASDVQEALHSGLSAKSPGLRNRGVKKAPFIVLIGANMPSILAEISFVSNPADEAKLQTPEYRQRIAESLYRGIAKYVNGLSGVKMASRVTKEEGQ
jgi:N-acetylmuramoyl-L-alanine amidase